MMTMMTPLGGWGFWDLNDDMMTQQNKVAVSMIYHPLLMISILTLTLLAGTNLSIIAPFIAGLWTISGMNIFHLIWNSIWYLIFHKFHKIVSLVCK